jgi:hypothetical protein
LDDGVSGKTAMDTLTTAPARITLRSWIRRFRRGRLEPLDSTAARVLAQVNSVSAEWMGVSVSPVAPVLVQDGIPVVYLVAQIDFWRMVQQTDMWPQEPVMLYVLVHRRTLADPWECTCILSAKPFAALESEPITLRDNDSPEAQIFARFWRELAGRSELVLSGLD